jgi:hypothetical protein
LFAGEDFMNEFLAKWQPIEFVFLVAILTTLIVVVFGFVIWHHVRMKQADIALRQEMLRRELSIEEMERFLKLPCQQSTNSVFSTPVSTDESNMQKVGQALVEAEVSADEIEQIMIMIQASDPPTKETVFQMIQGMVNGGADNEQLIGAIRGCCTPVRVASQMQPGASQALPERTGV